MGVVVARLTAVVDADTRGFDQGMSKVSADMRNIGQVSLGARASIEQLSDVLRTLPTQNLETIDATFRRLRTYNIDQVGRTLTMGITVPLVGLGIAAIKTSADIDALRRGLNAVTGSASETEKQMVRLKEIAKLPAVGYEEVIKASTHLQAAGMSAQTAERSIKAFANAVATAGGGRKELELVQQALEKMASLPSVQGREVREIQRQVPQMRQIMLKAFGTADTKELQAMGIDPKYFIQRIVSEFEKLPQVLGGAKNEFENLKDAVTQSLDEIGKALLPSVSANAKVMAEVIHQLARAYTALPKEVQQAIFGLGMFAATVGPVIWVVGTLVNSLRELRLAIFALQATKMIWGELSDRGMGTGAILKQLAFGSTGGLAGHAASGAGAKALGGAAAAGAGAIESAVGAGAGTAAVSGVERLAAARAEATFAKQAAARIAQEAEEAAIKAASTTGAGAAGGKVVHQMQIAAQKQAQLVAARAAEEAAARAVIEAEVYGGVAAASVQAGAKAAVGTSMGARLMGGAGRLLGGAGAILSRLALPAAIVGTAAFASSWMNDIADKRRGVQKVDMWDAISAGFGQYHPGPTAADLKAARDDFTETRRKGESPAQQARQDAEFARKIASQKAAADLDARQGVEDAKYRADLSRAKAAVGDDASAGETARSAIPIMEGYRKTLVDRQKALNITSKSSMEDQKYYWQLVTEETNIRIQEQGLNKAAQKEVEVKRKEAVQKAKEAARDARMEAKDRFDASRFATEAYADLAPEGMRDRARRSLESPALKQEQNRVASEMKRLLPQTATDAEARREYYDLWRQYWSIEKEGLDLFRRAKDEEKAEQDKVRAAQSAATAAGLTQAEVMSGGVRPDRRAEASARASIPLLRDRQRQVLDDAKRQKQGSSEYWNDVNEYWQIEGRIQDDAQSVAKEIHDRTKSAHDKAQTAGREQMELLRARGALIDAQLKNNPFLNETQRQRIGLGSTIAEYRQAMRPVKGETELEKLHRETEAEKLKGEILSQAGLTPRFGRTLGGGLLPMFNMRGFMRANQQLAQLGRQSARMPVEGEREQTLSFSREAANGRPVVFQVVLDKITNKEELRREIMRVEQEFGYHLYPNAPAY